MLNEYGSNYGTLRISFPATEIVAEEIAARIPSSNLRDELLKGEFKRLRFREKNAFGEIPDDWGKSQDLWNQEHSATAESLDQAIDRYFTED